MKDERKQGTQLSVQGLGSVQSAEKQVYSLSSEVAKAKGPLLPRSVPHIRLGISLLLCEWPLQVVSWSPQNTWPRGAGGMSGLQAWLGPCCNALQDIGLFYPGSGGREAALGLRASWDAAVWVWGSQAHETHSSQCEDWCPQSCS